ncbi:hypothetical protein FPHYL_3732 [Fusarium phyllophilum]|uniref:Uncharacterized protein n=1 Tax=Fusarium phyllophilum TaxID=47803 RepID=A0A8H5NIC9_9HYPO|nr:hypothetical protein FPHYL_3732 [Fusarium phyllophilum]
MSSPSPQIEVPALYRSSPASALQMRSVSGMWPSQLFADAVPRSWSKNVLVSLAKIISSASTKAGTTVDDVVAWFKENAELCGGCLLGQMRERLPSMKIPPTGTLRSDLAMPAIQKPRAANGAHLRAQNQGPPPAQTPPLYNREELVRSEHISILREKSAAAEDRLNEAKTLLDEIEPRVVALQ